MATLVPRGYTHPDAQQLLYGLYEEQLRLYGHADHPDATSAADVEPPDGLFLVAYTRAGGPVGCGGWRRLRGVSVPLTAEIKRLYVVPDRRGLGDARVLLGALERHAAQAGARCFVLETGAANTAALRLFERTGWTLRPPYVPGRDPAVNRALTKTAPPPAPA